MWLSPIGSRNDPRRASMVETLEGRRLLSGAPCDVDVTAAEPVAKAALVVRPARVTAGQVVGRYTGSVRLSRPFAYGPVKAELVIKTVNLSTGKITGTVRAPKLDGRAIAFSARSEIDAETGAFTIRFSRAIPGTGQRVSGTIQGTRNASTGALAGRFDGMAPYQGVMVDGEGTFAFRKVV